jgi:hypothetical protein
MRLLFLLSLLVSFFTDSLSFLSYFLGLTIAIPVPLYLFGYIFSEAFFTAWVVGTLTYAVGCSALIVYFPVYEEWDAVYTLFSDFMYWRPNAYYQEHLH